MGQRTQLHYYRWEGVYAADFTVEGVRQRVAALAEIAAVRHWNCLVAFDTRFMAGRLAYDAYQILVDHNVDCMISRGPVPFPVIERTLERSADCAVIMTAGNRAFWYGGLVLVTPALDQQLLELPLPERDRSRPFPPAGDAPEEDRLDLRMLYGESLRGLIDFDAITHTSLTLFVDPMSGTTSGYIPSLLGEQSQAKAIEINREIDPLFGRQIPHPTEHGLGRLRKLVRESDSHMGVGLSADGRLLGVVDNHGELLTPVELALVLASHLVHQQRQRGIVVVPNGGAANVLRAIEAQPGLRIEERSDPEARIAELFERDRGSLVVGVTAEGGVAIGRGGGIDALLAALVLLEAIARSGIRMRPLLGSLLSGGVE